MKNVYKSLFLLIVFLTSFLVCKAQDTLKKEDVDAEKVFLIVEEMPQFPGGLSEMFAFIQRNIRYPAQAASDNISGKVYLNFVVDTNGTKMNPRILKGIGGGCDEEAMRIFHLMPNWIPGKQNGKYVKVSYNLPVLFKLRPIDELIKEAMDQPSYPLLKQGKFEEAIKEFDRSIALHESDANAYYNRGIAKFKMNDTANACFDWGLAAYYNNKNVLEYLNILCDSLIILEEDTFETINFYKNSMKNDSNDAAKNHSVVEVKPEFPGGLYALYEFLAHNIHYPHRAREDERQGKVYVHFYISKNGKVSRPYVLRGFYEDCDNEALRVISLMPNWQPATRNGKPVGVLFNLPINFTLK